ncbi:MAG: hypothetical protein HOP13_00205 [Alphaproteobacteria bacterium]|nr:hypothetical protein [Alphaproteobacteria bacterium]
MPDSAALEGWSMIGLLRVAVVLVLGLSVSACALSEDTVSLQYQPMQNATEIPGAKQTGIVVSVVDARAENRDRVSVKKNGYGMEMAAIRSDRDVAGFVKEAIESELKARGFRVGEGPAQAKADLLKFYNDFKIGFFSGDAVAEVAFNIQVAGSNGAILYSKPISSSGKAADILLASGSNAKEALENGLRTAIANLMNDPAFIAAVLKSGTGVKPVS